MSAATSLRHADAVSAPAGRRARKILMREIHREHEERDRNKLADLRARLRAARAAHKEALRAASSRCRAHRVALRDRLKAERAATLAELRDKGARQRQRARAACGVDRDGATKETQHVVEDARAALEAERTYQNDLKRIERGNRASLRATKRATAAERRAESDDEVRGNVEAIDPSLVSLFDRVKRSIKAGPRESRTEAFLRYAEEHPGEVLESIDDRTDALIRDLERQQREAERRGGHRRTKRNPATTAAALRAYTRDHWGQKGTGEVTKLPAADPRIPSVELGELVAVIYRTKKGTDRVLTDYEHHFKTPRPRLAYNESGLVIAGGKYRVEPRGIVD